MRCKIVRFQKLMLRNMMRSTKSQKVLVLHYSIDIYSGKPETVHWYWQVSKYFISLTKPKRPWVRY